MPTTPQPVVNGALIAVLTLVLLGIWPSDSTWRSLASALASLPTPMSQTSQPEQPTAVESTPTPEPPREPIFLRTDGSRILTGSGEEVRITGINWFGMETGTFAPHGVWQRSWEELLDVIVQSGFNTIRLPYSNEVFDPKSYPGNPSGIDFDLNPDFKGLTGIEIMDKIIEGAGRRGLKVLLDRHRPDQYGQSNLWYTARVSEEQWIKDWVMLAQRYLGNDTVIGADLHNEPHAEATWGTGDPRTDWRLAAEKAGNAILNVNPHWLIVVEGVSDYQNKGFWWGANLRGARTAPVRLNVADRLVYSPHDYGPGVHVQNWFLDKSFPDNLPGLWREHWSYLAEEGIAPVLVGEFGGRSVDASDKEGVWQRKLLSYIKQLGISYTYWSLNPNSGDTGGVLLDDWVSVDHKKLEVLSSYQAPLIGANRFSVINPNIGPPKGPPPPLPTPKPKAGEKKADKQQ